jgi:cob(I)alamin adenosyltransferase
MSIVTKKGDKGLTLLYKGGRVAKDSLRVEILGTLDELSCFLGLSKCLLKSRPDKKLITLVQNDLFVVGTEIVTPLRYLKTLKKRIDKKAVTKIEDAMSRLERKMSAKSTRFHIPGKNLVAATLHVGRSIARRAERRIISLKGKKMLNNDYMLQYLNRISDVLFLLACKYEQTHRDR